VQWYPIVYEILAALGGTANRNLLPEFRERWSGVPWHHAVTCIKLFTDALVKRFWTTSSCLRWFVLFLFTTLPEDWCKLSVQVPRIGTARPFVPNTNAIFGNQTHALYVEWNWINKHLVVNENHSIGDRVAERCCACKLQLSWQTRTYQIPKIWQQITFWAIHVWTLNHVMLHKLPCQSHMAAHRWMPKAVYTNPVFESTAVFPLSNPVIAML